MKIRSITVETDDERKITAWWGEEPDALVYHRIDGTEDDAPAAAVAEDEIGPLNDIVNAAIAFLHGSAWAVGLSPTEESTP